MDFKTSTTQGICFTKRFREGENQGRRLRKVSSIFFSQTKYMEKR